MNMPTADLQVAILDVGHGNCTVIRDGPQSVVVDVPLGVRLGKILIDQNCAEIKHLVLSHMDADHIGGAMRVLSDPDVVVEKVWGSADSIKDTKTHLDLLYAIQNANDSGATSYSCNLNASAGRDLSFGRVDIDVLHPSIVFAGIGPNLANSTLGPISSNGMSAVLRVSMDSVRCAVLTGDADEAALSVMLERNIDLRAPVLVFPHHGGLPGHVSNAGEFAERLARSVSPDLVIFSTGRGRYNNPRSEILDGVRIGAPESHIGCTQLNRECHPRVMQTGIRDNGVRGWPSRGTDGGACCMGTVVIELDGRSTCYYPALENHRKFVDSRVESPKCATVTLSLDARRQ